VTEEENMAGKPQNGLVQRLRAFFQANPEEELTQQQALAKFGCTTTNFTTAVSILVTNGEIEKLRIIRAAKPPKH
jgi:hypothetical protein